MKTDLYIIETLTNTHVGSGDINFDIIDNQVQRDSITGLPTINSSSLKGAFRELFEEKEAGKLVKFIFGGNREEDKETNDTTHGNYNFFSANLLTMPVRSNKKFYFNAISNGVIKELLETIENFDIKIDEELVSSLKNLLEIDTINPVIFENINDCIIEDFDNLSIQNSLNETIKNFLGEDIVLFNDKDFKKLSLPVIARNKLENGESQNLWYEEVVPKKSKFYFCIGKPDNLAEYDKKEKIDGFERRFDNEGDKVQFGANKSIGYGYSLVKKVSKWVKII